MRQQIEGIGELGKWGLETLSPGADIRDALGYSGLTTKNFLDGDVLGALGNFSLTGVSLLGLGTPGSLKGAKDLVDDAGNIIADFNPGDTRWGKGGKHLFGAKGTKIAGSHTIYNDTTNHRGYRIDVENRAPGKAPGQIHLQTPDKQKYIHNVNTKEWKPDDETTRFLTKKEMNMLEKDEFQRALNKALKYMGEQE